MIYLKPNFAGSQQSGAIDWPQRFKELANTAQHKALRDYYQQGMPALDTPLKDVPLVAVDFETTGLDVNQHGIVSMAVIPMTTQRIELGRSQQWVLKPRRVLTDESVTIHGITHSDIESAPDLSEVIEPLLQAIAGKVWVVHYRGIEAPFLQHALQQRINESIEFPTIDTMEIEARFHRQRPRFVDRLLRRPAPSIRLADSRERYHLPFYAPHDAMTDALACGELLQAQVLHKLSPDAPLAQYLSC